MRNLRKVGLGIAMAGALVLGACTTVTPDDLKRVESQVSDLQARVEAAEAKAAAAEAASATCTRTCEAASEKADRMFQQSLRK